MTFYCGIDLGARTSHLSVIDPTGKVLTSRKIGHDIELFLKTLEPYRRDLKVVVEATFNWYWHR